MSERTLVDQLIEEQQSLTAVGRFARISGQGGLPSQARYYRDLIPFAKPQLGEQYAFAVDLDACTGCKACVSACHSLNGLDEDEMWRDIGLLSGGKSGEPYQQTVTTACHHCVEPACLEGCPVMAYEKDSVTGIVRHLDDQCIGCQYCVLKCPYDVPKYSEKRGIVRKCDMCYSRLTADEAPACVQACPSGAITIRVVQKAEVTKRADPGTRMLPGAFESSYTKPATSYSSRKVVPANARSGDAGSLRLEHAHWPLIAMLVSTQTAAGLFIAAAVIAVMLPEVFVSTRTHFSITGFGVLQFGLAVSVLHLGRPLGAWRALLGWRTSWMSREILAFGLFATAAASFVASCLYSPLSVFSEVMSHLAALLGMVGVACSAMVYVDTRRSYWRFERTWTLFGGTTLILGTTAACALLEWCSTHEAARLFAMAATILRTALFGWEFVQWQQALGDQKNADHLSALTIWKLLRPLVFAQAALFGAASAAGLFVLGLSGKDAFVAATVCLLLSIASQLVERTMFFRAVIAPRMPGSFAR